ncbi:MAG TPA: hypothetical protein VFO79_10210, partial [Xanthomonadales bacterium]|nr:hypothetical protein [Xanthomonadales bacterium]
SLDAAAIGHATVAHDGFAPNHQLSFFFRGSDGERVVDFPRTSRRATIALTSADGWHGTIFEVGLVYGPAGNVPTLLEDNTLRVHALELEAPSAGTRARAALTRLAQIAPRVGSDINVLPGALVAIAGAALLLGLVGAAATRARTRHAMLALALFAFALAELAIWRQWLVSHQDASAIAAARRASNRPIEFDWELVGIASRIREALGPESSRVAFLLAFEDPYVADRLKFHLLPLRAWRGQGIAPDPDRCLFVLTDRDTPAPLLREDTAFGPVALATLADAPPECRWNTLPSSR